MKSVLLYSLTALLSVPLAAAVEPHSGSIVPDGRHLARPVVNFNLSNNNRPVSQLLSAPVKVGKAAPDLFTGRTMSGVVTWSNAWDGLSMSQESYGLYSIDMGSLSTVPLCTDAFRYDFTTAAFTPTTLVGVRIIGAMSFSGVEIVGIDTETNSEIWNEVLNGGNLDFLAYDIVPGVMAWNPVDGKIWTVNYNANLTGMDITVLDTDTRRFKKVTSWKINKQPLTMAFLPDGTCYTIAEDGILYRLQTSDGSLESVGYTGVNPALYGQSMAWDGITASFVWSAVTDRGSFLYSVDPATAETVQVGRFPNNERVSGNYLPLNTAQFGAPAMADGINVRPREAGSLTADISFGIPGLTYGGDPLQAPVSYSLWVDGEAVASKTSANPGAYVSLEHEFTTGNHRIALLTTSLAGDSPLFVSTVYTGYDTPAAPASVTMSISGNRFQAHWDAVTEGVNGGYVNADAVTYSLYLMPGNIKVAEGVTDTSAEFDIPSELRSYHLEVAAVNSDGTEGVRASSETLLAGNAYTVPVFENFENPGSLDVWRIVDGDGDGACWRYAEWYAEMQCDPASGIGDNRLISPPIALKANEYYSLTLNMRTTFAGYYGKIRVMSGLKDADFSDYVECAVLDNLEYQDFVAVSTDLSVDADGDYCIAIVECSDSERSSMVRINSFEITKIAEKSAPEAVGALSVTPASDDVLAATVEFDAPAKDLAGNALMSIDCIEIAVDGKVLDKITDAAPGQHISRVVSGIEKPGTTAFTVVASNASGAGRPISVTAFIGVFTAPWTESFANPEAMDLWTEEYDFAENPDQPILTYSSYDQAASIAYTDRAGNGSNLWLFSPQLKLDDESVYRWKFEYKHMSYGNTPFFLTIGKAPESLAHTELMQLPVDQPYDWREVEAEIVTDEAGKFNFGYHAASAVAWEYVCYSIRNVSLVYMASAFAPDKIEALECVADKEGRLEADLSFLAPKVDFKGRPLTAVSKLEVFREGTLQPLKVFENVAPGDKLSLHDSNAVYGRNTYSFVAWNEHGKGKTVTETIFVGLDKPVLSEVRLTSTPDNMQARLSWTLAEQGVSGGVVVPEKTTYNLYVYQEGTGRAIIEAIGISGNEYTFDVPDRVEYGQYCFHYGVMPVSEAGEGEMTLKSIMLGKLYRLPYSESFGKGLPKTGPWSTLSVDPTCTWMPFNEFWSGYDAQDKDGGCVAFFNGEYGTNYSSDRLITPKVSLEGFVNPVLSFHVLLAHKNGSVQHKLPALMRVCVSADDDEFVYLTEDSEMSYDGSNKNWKCYEIDLSEFVGSNNIRIGFDGYTCSYNELLMLDNLKISGQSSVDFPEVARDVAVFAENRRIRIDGSAGRHATICDIAGRVYYSGICDSDSFCIEVSSGYYIVNAGPERCKVMVK